MNHLLPAVFVVTSLLTGQLKAQPISDQQITNSVQQALQRDYRLKSAQIQVSTLSGSVTLKGTVSSFSDRSHAEQLAKRTAGVRSVINRLRVSPVANSDDEITHNIRRRLDQSTFIRPRDINVDVASGVVTLTGHVPTWAQTRQAQLVASEVLGVKLVRNHLQVDGLNEVGDAKVKTDVESELRRDIYLEGAGYRSKVYEVKLSEQTSPPLNRPFLRFP